MTLTTTSHLARRAKVTSPGTLPASTAALIRHRQQVRGIRFGRIWASYLDGDFNRDSYRRGRRLRYKYIETLNQRAAWEDQPWSHSRNSTLKRMIHGYWNPDGPRPPGGRGGKREAQQSPENPEGVRPGQNIEDAERAPMEHLLFGKKTEGRPYEYDHWQSPLENLRNTLRQHLVKVSIAKGAPARGETAKDAEADYFIDPITNRKIYKSDGDEGPTKSFKAYRSQFTHPNETGGERQEPIFFDGPPPEEELKKYRQVELDTDKVQWHHQIRFGSWTQGQQLFKDEESIDRRPVGGMADELPKYDDLAKYKPVLDDVVTGHETKAQAHKDLGAYGAFRSHEPDGKYKLDAEKLEQNVDAAELEKYGGDVSKQTHGTYQANATPRDVIVDASELGKYQSVRSHESNGKYAGENGEVDKGYDPAELRRYQAVRSHEPDGRYKAEVEQSEDAYDPTELARYQAVRSHEPDGRYKAEVEKAEEGYDPQELGRYGAIRSHEPDGMYKAEAEIAGDIVSPEELARYGAFRAHEPDGKYKAEAETAEAGYDKGELSQYGAFRSHEPDGKYAASYVREGRGPGELDQYAAGFRSHEPDGKYAASYTGTDSVGGEASKYTAFRSHEPDGKYAAPVSDAEARFAELGQYKSFRSHEPDGKYAASHAEHHHSGYDDLDSYQAFRSHEPDGKYANQPAPEMEPAPLERYKPFEYNAAPVLPDDLDPAEVQRYRPVRHNEPDGKPADAGEQSYDPSKPNEFVHEPYDPSEVEKYQAFRWNEPNGKPGSAPQMEEKTNYQKMLESLMPGQVKAHGSEEAATSGTASMTGNYVRDFPEEFAKSWTAEKSKSTLLPDDFGSKKDENEATQVPSSAPDSAIQPALDRLQESTSTAPQASTEPALFKVLAFDPATESIQTFDSTSAVSPLASGEALLRLARPVQFLPHLSTLQEQGFEIVGATDQILILRKKLSDGAETVNTSNTTAAAEATTSDASVSTTPVNPIDMTGTGGRHEIHSVAGSRYASPTGFVNYDPVTIPEKFISGIDVRREEDVFSGPKTEGDGKARRSIPKRLAISAAWVGGVSYAIGVVAEYFKSGGSDGKGPKGF